MIAIVVVSSSAFVPIQVKKCQVVEATAFFAPGTFPTFGQARLDGSDNLFCQTGVKITFCFDFLALSTAIIDDTIAVQQHCC